MKVKELIEKLKELPQDLEVYVEEPYDADIDMYGVRNHIKDVHVDSEGDFEWVDIKLDI
jgi:hypothetical protein